MPWKTSEKTNDPILKKYSDRRAEGQTEPIYRALPATTSVPIHINMKKAKKFFHLFDNLLYQWFQCCAAIGVEF